MPTNDNHFVALRDAFTDDLDSFATAAADGVPARYTWRDLERGSAMLANLLDSLDLPADARIGVLADESVEAQMLCLAVLRAGFVYLPLATAWECSQVEHVIRDAAPGVVVCPGRHFSWVSRRAFTTGTSHVFTLDGDRGGSLLQRAAVQSDRHAAALRAPDDLAMILYSNGTTGRSEGAMLSHADLSSDERVQKLDAGTSAVLQERFTGSLCLQWPEAVAASPGAALES